MGIYSGHSHVENEEAYQRAIERRIMANRAKSGRRKWFAREADAQRIHDWLFSTGEFAPVKVTDPRCTVFEGDEHGNGYWVDHYEDPKTRMLDCKCRTVNHPLTGFSGGAFLNDMRKAVDEWGGLTPGQHAGVQKALVRAEERLAGREAERSAQMEADRSSAHVGTVGERRDWVLAVSSCIERPGEYGLSYFHVCRDPDGNVVIYSGSHRWERGTTVRCKATIKRHAEREGVAQTWINRLKEKSK